jgi:hypothetical protein
MADLLSEVPVLALIEDERAGFSVVDTAVPVQQAVVGVYLDDLSDEKIVRPEVDLMSQAAFDVHRAFVQYRGRDL